MKITSKKQYLAAVERLKKAAEAYYDSEELLMDDGEYDEMVKAVGEAETKNPAWGTSGLVEKVAGGSSRAGVVRHSTGMLSLDNVYDDDELRDWYARLEKAVGRSVTELCVEPKLDGLALAARYENGVLVAVLTRGDGEQGEDVTLRARHALGLPSSLPGDITIELRGECVMTAEQFEAANKMRTTEGKAAFANPRNAVAGSIRRVHGDEVTPMTFCCYGVVSHVWAEEMSHTTLMSKLQDMGVNTAIAMAETFGAGACESIEEAVTKCNSIAARRAELDCGIDGAVVKANGTKERDAAGSTGKAPRWAVARKFPPDTKLTTLRGIEVGVGRTGALGLRAVLEPVSVGGVVIESCTLSNPSEVARKDLRIGDKVWVRRAGEVIPEITTVAVEFRSSDSMPWEAPTTCPRCGRDLDTSQKVWRCRDGRTCGLAELIEYAVSRDALDVEGLGEKVIAQLVANGLVSDVADVFALKSEDIAGLERMGEVSAAKIMLEIEKAKSLPLHRVLVALGVRHTGRRMCRRLAGAFKDMDSLMRASVEDLAAVEGVGEVRAAAIRGELDEMRDVVNRLRASGVNMVESAAGDAVTNGPLSGKRVCVTGSITGLNRDEAHARVEALGGTVVAGVSKKTDLLVVGDGGGGKAKKASELGVATMDSSEFLAL